MSRLTISPDRLTLHMIDHFVSVNRTSAYSYIKVNMLHPAKSRFNDKLFSSKLHKTCWKEEGY